MTSRRAYLMAHAMGRMTMDRSSMDRVNVILPTATITRMASLSAAGTRSQFINYAVLAMLATLRGESHEAEGYEKMARALVNSRG